MGIFLFYFYFLKNLAFTALYIYIFTLQMGKREPRGMADVSVGSWALKHGTSTLSLHLLLLSALKRLSLQGQPSPERAPC